MIYKTINSIILAVFVGIYIITMFGTKMAFGTVNENINCLLYTSDAADE